MRLYDQIKEELNLNLEGFKGLVRGYDELIAKLSQSVFDALYAFAEPTVISFGGNKQLFNENGPESVYSITPVLKSVLTFVYNNYISLFKTFFERLEKDYAQIATFINVKNPGRVKDVLVGNTKYTVDGGKRVLIVTFEKGKVVYKPRDPGTDVFYYGLCEGFFKGKLYAPKVLPQKGYFWCEFIKDTPKRAINYDTLAYNLGILSVVCQILGSWDVRPVNTVVMDNMPVLIDLENIVGQGTGNTTRMMKQKQKLNDFMVFVTPLLQFAEFFKPRNRGICLSGSENAFFKGYSDGVAIICKDKEAIKEYAQAIKGAYIRVWINAVGGRYEKIKDYIKTAFNTPVDEAKKHIKDTLTGYNRFNADYGIEETELNCFLSGDDPRFCVRGDSNTLFNNGEPVLKNYTSVTPYERLLNALSYINPKELYFYECAIKQLIESVQTKDERDGHIYSIVTGPDGTVFPLRSEFLDAPMPNQELTHYIMSVLSVKEEYGPMGNQFHLVVNVLRTILEINGFEVPSIK